MDVAPILAALAFTYILNVPFGYWRADAKRRARKLEWVAAIHVPVPLVFAARMLAGATLTMIPVFVVAFFLGQLTGGRIHGRMSEVIGETGKCLVHDLRLLLSRSGKDNSMSRRG